MFSENDHFQDCDLLLDALEGEKADVVPLGHLDPIIARGVDLAAMVYTFKSVSVCIYMTLTHILVHSHTHDT